MNVGDVCDGVVVRIENYGLWVDVDGVQGLLRIPDLSWDCISHPSEVATVGEQVRFQILGLNEHEVRPHEQFVGSIKILLPKPERGDLDSSK